MEGGVKIPIDTKIHQLREKAATARQNIEFYQESVDWFKRILERAEYEIADIERKAMEQ